MGLPGPTQGERVHRKSGPARPQAENTAPALIHERGEEVRKASGAGSARRFCLHRRADPAPLAKLDTHRACIRCRCLTCGAAAVKMDAESPESGSQPTSTLAV